MSLLALVLVPFVVSIVRAFHYGFVPTGDEANIATRALDVFSRHPPLTGLPSTSEIYGKGIFTNHPGPIEFYLLALPIRVLGQTTGPLLTAATINLAFVLIALWAIYRRAGLWAMLGAGVVMQALLRSGGTSVLSETLSSNMTMYSMLATAVLAWAIADGDLELLPLTAFVAIYAAQQHLAAALVVLPVIAIGCSSLMVGVVARARRGDRSDLEQVRRYGLGAGVISVACWIPVAVDQLTSHPGNLTRILDFARDHTVRTLGLSSGLTQAAHAIAPPSLLAMTNANGDTLTRSAGIGRDVLAVLVVVALVAILVQAHRRRPALSRLAAFTLVILAAGVVDGSKVPQGTEVARNVEYRWAWVAAFMTWTTIGWALAILLPRVSARRFRALEGIALVTAAALIAGGTFFVGGADSVPQNAPLFPADRRFEAAVLDHVDLNQTVAVFFNEPDHVSLNVGFSIVFRLVEAGVRVELSLHTARAQSTYRRYHPRSDPTILIVTTGVGSLAQIPAATIASYDFDPAYAASLDALLAQNDREPIRLAPDAEARADRIVPGLFPAVEKELEAFRRDPRAVLSQPELVDLILRGVLRAPGTTTAQLQRFQRLSAHRTTFYLADRVSVRMLTPAQVNRLSSAQKYALLTS